MRAFRVSVLVAVAAAFLSIAAVASASQGRVMAQDDCDAAFHVQSRSTVTDTLPTPPPAANFGADEDTFV